MAGTLTARRAFVAVCCFAGAVGLWNVAAGDPGLGYDAPEHWAYADGLVPGGHLPHGTGEYYTPPGFYALAGLSIGDARVYLGAIHNMTNARSLSVRFMTTSNARAFFGPIYTPCARRVAIMAPKTQSGSTRPHEIGRAHV